MPEKTDEQLLDEYYKKHPEKRSLGRRLSDQRKANAAEKAKYNAIYREEFNKQRAVSLKERAKQEAIEKFRPTRKQKLDNFVDAIGNLGGMQQQQRRKPPFSKKKPKKRKQKYAIVDGKAYPVGGQPQQNQTHQKKKKKKGKKSSSDPFNLGGLEDIGSFNF